MLIIKRKADEAITIEPVEGSDTSRTINELFTSGAIIIKLLEVGPKQVKVAIEAPPQLKIWRERPKVRYANLEAVALSQSFLDRSKPAPD